MQLYTFKELGVKVGDTVSSPSFSNKPYTISKIDQKYGDDRCWVNGSNYWWYGTGKEWRLVNRPNPDEIEEVKQMNDLKLHNGGAYLGNPDDVVDIILRSLSNTTGVARNFFWGSHNNHPGDIIAYRVVKAAPVKTTKRRYYRVAEDGTIIGFIAKYDDTTHYADFTLIDGKLPDEQTIVLKKL